MLTIEPSDYFTQLKITKPWRMSETTFKCHPKFLGYNMLSHQPALMTGASLFSVSSLKPHHLNMENVWNKHVWSHVWTKPDWLRKLPGRESKSSFGEKKITLWREFVAGAFTYQLLRSCQVTMAHRNKEATRHHSSLCFLTSPGITQAATTKYK